MKRSDDHRAAHGGPLRGLRVSAVTWLISATVIGSLWLFMAALPALADGGPHIFDKNNGSLGINADGCAGCHRAHTAQGPFLLNAADENDLCLTCHGSAGVGATTDVLTGVQYKIALQPGSPGQGADPSVLLGALRNGGFEQARIASGNPSRVLRNSNTLSSSDDHWGKVQVGEAQSVTSAHLNLPENALDAPEVAWGNGINGSGEGPTVELSCASCHNPHGNGQYRILNPIPDPTVTAGTFTPVAAPGVTVTDSPIGTADPATGGYPTKNYTVIQVQGPSYLLYASDVIAAGYGPTTGDYWHVRVPWNSSSASNDAPNGIPVNSGLLVAFNTQMTAWCSACHTRYYSLDAGEPSGDAIYAYRHETISNRACTTCHVAHGSNARMAGPFSLSQPFPNDDTVTYNIPTATDPVGLTGDSRLLKVDNRGTCQMCHDPTYTYAVNTPAGPLPTPGRP